MCVNVCSVQRNKDFTVLVIKFFSSCHIISLWCTSFSLYHLTNLCLSKEPFCVTSYKLRLNNTLLRSEAIYTAYFVCPCVPTWQTEKWRDDRRLRSHYQLLQGVKKRMRDRETGEGEGGGGRKMEEGERARGKGEGREREESKLEEIKDIWPNSLAYWRENEGGRGGVGRGRKRDRGWGEGGEIRRKKRRNRWKGRKGWEEKRFS